MASTQNDADTITFIVLFSEKYRDIFSESIPIDDIEESKAKKRFEIGGHPEELCDYRQRPSC